MERQSDLSLRQGDSTAHVRMDAINKDTMDHYFALLSDTQARKAEEKARKTVEKTGAKPGEKRKGRAKADSNDSHEHSTRSKTQPPQKKVRVNDSIDDSECCVCFMTYEEDIANKSGKDWVACACGRWLHKDCAEDCILDNAGEERLCPLCLDILT